MLTASWLLTRLKVETPVRILEIIAGLIVAVIVFAVFKLIGVVIHVAVIAAIIGFVIGLGVTWMIRSKSS